MFRPETTLNRRALRREALQLGVVALASLAVLLFTGRALQLVAAVVDLLALVLAGVAAVVTWRVGGRGGSLALYVLASIAFLALAGANVAG